MYRSKHATLLVETGKNEIKGGIFLDDDAAPMHKIFTFTIRNVQVQGMDRCCLSSLLTVILTIESRNYYFKASCLICVTPKLVLETFKDAVESFRFS